MNNGLIEQAKNTSNFWINLMSKLPEDAIAKNIPILATACVAIYAINRYFNYQEINSALEHNYNCTVGTSAFTTTETIVINS